MRNKYGQILLNASVYILQRNSLPVDGNIYAPLPYVEHSGEEIKGCHPRNAKLFKRIKHKMLINES